MQRVRSRSRDEAKDGTAIPPFQSFLEDHRTLVYRFLLASVGAEEADDCFQETFLAALRAYPELRNGENLTGWILTIATRKAIDAGRGRSRRPIPLADPADAVDPPGPAEGEAFDRTNPLWAAVRALPGRQRAAVVHRFVLDRSYADIARAMECSEETARANVYQGLKRLREAWGER
jgi:RNA polymerase sigma factor (sigma-70 family)